jgi:polygalacturonase
MRSLLLASWIVPLVAASAIPGTALEERASCTVTTYSALASAVSSCTAITISNLAVPAGSSVDLSKLKSGATVTFSGKTVRRCPVVLRLMRC